MLRFKHDILKMGWDLDSESGLAHSPSLFVRRQCSVVTHTESALAVREARYCGSLHTAYFVRPIAPPGVLFSFPWITYGSHSKVL